MPGTSRSVEHHPGRGPAVLRARRHCLEPFTPFADRATLVRSADLTRRTGCVGKALASLATFEGEPVAAQADSDSRSGGWLLELLET